MTTQLVIRDIQLLTIKIHEIEYEDFFSIDYDGVMISHFYSEIDEALSDREALIDVINHVGFVLYQGFAPSHDPDLDAEVGYSQVLEGRHLNVVVLFSKKGEVIEAFSYYPGDLVISSDLFLGMSIREAIERCLEEERAFINYEGIYSIAH